jgi:DNA-binding transcriptional ArsR family regulator
MNEGPSLAKLAALIADPSRAGMLTTLLGGQALTATELADSAGVGRATASAHLAKLVDAGFLAVAAQGRHRYFRLAGPAVARMLEQLIGMAQAAGATTLVTGPRDTALRHARVCYDHLAGDLAVALHERLLARRALVHDDAGALAPGPTCAEVFAPLAIDVSALGQARRPLCRGCLDWSARRDHLAGALGAALLAHALERGWARREPASRVVRFTPAGDQAWRAIAA